MADLNKIADELQNELCKLATGRPTNFSVLGADWACNLPENFHTFPFQKKQQLIFKLAERKFGELPYCPMLTEDDLHSILN